MVLSGGSSSARFHGVERFYCPPAIRRQLQQRQLQEEQQQQQILEQRQQLLEEQRRQQLLEEQRRQQLLEEQRRQQLLEEQRRQQAAAKARQRQQRPPTPSEPREAESHAESDDSASKLSVSSSSSLSSRLAPPSGNLERFLEFTTPLVPAQYIPKRSTRGWRTSDSVEMPPYYNLDDLWESFKEWSAYGAGVPLVLNGSNCVVQYYVPFLSAIQLYVDKSRRSLCSRVPYEESDGEAYQDTSSEGSEGSSESEDKRLIRERRQSLRNTSCVAQEGFSSDDGEACNQPQLPVFEFLEHDPPYSRQPLADKISGLVSKFPDLKTYRSCDLLPSSWISVAWYPIYRIPVGPTLQDLDACFLTFHSLSTPLEDIRREHPEVYSPVNNRTSRADVSGKLPLHLLGLASYKFRGSIWISDQQHEWQLASSLMQTADIWLRHRQVDHPDYRFFLSHYNASS